MKKTNLIIIYYFWGSPDIVSNKNSDNSIFPSDYSFLSKFSAALFCQNSLKTAALLTHDSWGQLRCLFQMTLHRDSPCHLLSPFGQVIKLQQLFMAPSVPGFSLFNTILFLCLHNSDNLLQLSCFPDEMNPWQPLFCGHYCTYSTESHSQVSPKNDPSPFWQLLNCPFSSHSFYLPHNSLAISVIHTSLF